MKQLIGQRLHNRYCILSLLGHKTGRRTFLASDVQTESPVVIKLLLFNPDFTWEDLKLFEREAETLKALDHPAIPRYLDSFEVDTDLGKGFALVQSYIEARSLQDWMQSGGNFSEDGLRVIAKELLEILDYLHGRQPPIIHRDIKPSNILVGNHSGNSPSQVYLVDFGSVQTAAQGGTITVVGTYGYMPPEQFGGRTMPASDLYGLGTTLIYLTTGQHPADLPQQDLRVEFEKFTNLSQPFIRWIRWLTEPSISKRPASAKEALQQVPQDSFRRVPYNSLDAFASGVAAPLSNQRFSLATHSPRSSIQLKPTSTVLEIKVPSTQIFITSAEETQFFLNYLGGYGILAGVIALFGIEIWVWLLPLLFFCALFQGFLSLSYRPDSYQIVFLIEGGSILISLFSSNPKNSTVFARERLRSILAGPQDIPYYHLTVSCHYHGNAVRITGSHAEIQWLCDELSDWTGFQIRYQANSAVA